MNDFSSGLVVPFVSFDTSGFFTRGLITSFTIFFGFDSFALGDFSIAKKEYKKYKKS